jgi:hypothetical protein
MGRQIGGGTGDWRYWTGDRFIHCQSRYELLIQWHWMFMALPFSV